MDRIFKKLSLIYGKHDPEDLEQELYIYSWKLNRQGVPEPVVKQACRWLAMDYYKKRKREREIFFPMSEMRENQEPSTRLPESFRFQFNQIFMKLLPLEQEVLEHICFGFTVRETAQALGHSKDVVHRIVLRIKEKVVDFEGKE